MKKRAIDSTRCYLVILVIVIFQTLANCQFEGKLCYHEDRKTNGVCKLLTDCQIAVQDFRAGKFPQDCGIQGITGILCCPEIERTIEAPISEHLSVGEKAKRACKRYAKLILKLDAGPEQVENCPWAPQFLFRTTQGTKTIQGEFPHMALIGYGTSDNYKWRCGGSLISDKFILTSAHCCFVLHLGEPQVVRLGDLNYTDPSDNQYVQQIKIKKFYIHSDYKRAESYYNDIALLELETPAALNIYVKPACLQVNTFNYPIGIITYWSSPELGTLRARLLKATVQRFTPQICNKTYMHERRRLPRGIDENLQICYGTPANSSETCRGDTDGPIQVYADVYCSYYLFGITSAMKRCGHEAIPAVYVKLSYYIEWIENLVWP